MIRRRAAAWTVLSAVSSGWMFAVVPAARAEGPCRIDAPFDYWAAVQPPVAGAEVHQLDADPCTLFAAAGTAVHRSEDGGSTWRLVHRASRPVARVLTSGLGAETVVLALDGPAGGAEVSFDGGRRFRRAAGTERLAVTAAHTAAQGGTDAFTTYLAGRPLPTETLPQLPGAGPSVLFWDAETSAFRPMLGSAQLAPRHVVVDPTDSSLVWVDTHADGARGGLLHAADPAGTNPPETRPFVPPASPVVGTVSTLDVIRAANGEAVLLVTTDTGVRASADRGLNWSQLSVERATGASFDSTSLGIVVVTRDPPTGRTGVLRANDGRNFTPADEGLPASGCDGSTLRRDRGVVSTLLMRCGDRTYRYRSSARDLVRRPPGEPEPSAPPRPPTAGLEQMTPLRTWPFPQLVYYEGRSSATLGFDGYALYYAGWRELVLHRMSARDGRDLGDLDLRGGLIEADAKKEAASSQYQTDAYHVDEIDYDAKRDLLMVVVDGKQYTVDVRTGEQRLLFDWGQPMIRESYDPHTDTFARIQNQGDRLERWSRDGLKRYSCQMTYQGGFATGGGGASFFGSAVATAGDGDVYVQLEDDASVYRFGPRCELKAAYVHRRYSESTSESDQMVCDTVTFDQPALWIRDASLDSVTAYAIPNGYCPVNSALDLPAKVTVRAGQTVPICARLSMARRPLVPAGKQPVTIEVGDTFAASGVTDANGRVCVEYTAPDAAAQAATSPDATDVVVDELDTHAVFLGTASYRPSADRGRLAVTAPVVRPVDAPARPAGVPPVVQQPPRLPQHQPQPIPQPQAQPQPQVNPQTQPQPQGQPVAQAAAVPQEQSQPQLATVTVPQANAEAELAMSAYRPQRRVRDVPLGFALATAVAVCANIALAREFVTRRADIRRH